MKIPEIKETKNYEIFNRLKGNRDVNCVKKIVDSIRKIGYMFNPIMVNEKMEVIDGQNRLEAAKQLNLPVYYYIQKGVGIEEAREMNLGRTNWKPLNYAKSYAEEGMESYQQLLKLMSDYPWFKLQEIAGIATNTILSTGWISRIISEGEFCITNQQYKSAEDTLNALNDIQDVLNKIIGSRRTYITSIAWCFNVKGVNKTRFIKVIKEKYPLLRPVCETDMFLKDLSDIYNNGLDKNKRIYFDYEYKTK